jgi:hypothetical protein
MNRIASGLCIAAAFSFAASLGAQTSTSSATGTTMGHDQEVTVTGCLQRGADGNYMLTNAMMDTTAHGGATTTGTTGSTTGTTGSTTATGSTTSGSAGATSAASSWVLEGGSDLDKHVGHKIQVTGRQIDSSKKDYETPSATGSGTSTTGTTAGTTATGTATTGTTGTTGTSGSEMSSQRSSTTSSSPKLDVKSVKMISSSCS